VLKRAVKTAIFSTRKKTSEKKFSFLFIEQIVNSVMLHSIPLQHLISFFILTLKN
jgi:hypothetical protein